MSEPAVLNSSLSALRIALWLETRQRVNSWRAVLRSPAGLFGYIIVIALLAVLVVFGIWIRSAYGVSGEGLPEAEAQLLQAWGSTFLIVTASIVYLVSRIGFSWHRVSTGFRTSDVDFLFATPALNVRLMRALMFARESLGRLGAVVLSGVIIAVIFFDAATLRTLGNYYLSGGYLALSYVALRFAEYTAYRHMELWVAITAQRVRYLGWCLTAGAVVWGIASVATLITVVSAIDLPAGSPTRTEAILGHPALRLVALPSVAAADALVAPARGLNLWIGTAGVLWLAVIALCSRQVWRNAVWLREAVMIGIQHGAAQNRPHQTQTPYTLRLALQASAKPPTIATPKLFQRWSPRGVLALLWKDQLMEWRVYHPVALLFIFTFGAMFFAGGVVLTPLAFRVSPPIGAGVMSLVLLVIAMSADDDRQYNFNRLETQIDFLRALPFSGRAMVRYFALSGSLGVALLSGCIYLPALVLSPSQGLVLACGFMFTNLCLIALALLRTIEGMLTADFALEAQHGLTQAGVRFAGLLSSLTAGGLQIIALSWGGLGGILILLCLIRASLIVLYALQDIAVAFWERL